MNFLFYELQIIYYIQCSSDTESNIFKSADSLKYNDNKYVILWLSKWHMSTNSDLGLILIILVNKSFSKLGSKILDAFFSKNLHRFRLCLE